MRTDAPQRDGLRSSSSGSRLLCIGNGGVVRRDRAFWTHRCVQSFLRELGTYLNEVSFCAWLDPGDDPLAQYRLDEIPNGRTVALPALRGSRLRKLGRAAGAMRTLSREVRRSSFIYLYWPGRIASVVSVICRAFRKPYGIYFRGEQVEKDPTFEGAFRNARFVLTTGDQLRAIAGRYCADVENVTPMTSVRPEHLTAPRPKRPGEPWRLLYVGRVEERKGVFDLVRALEHLEDPPLPFTLTLVGHCYDTKAFWDQVPSRVAGKVRLVEAVASFEQLIPYFLNADLFVFPSHDEGFPRVLYEAMALGTPILTTFVGSIGTMMKDRENCLRLEVRNPGQIATAIREAATNESLRMGIAWSAHESIQELMETWRRSHAVQVAERLGVLVPGSVETAAV